MNSYAAVHYHACLWLVSKTLRLILNGVARSVFKVIKNPSTI